jgi:hypothetical protein
LRLEEYKILLIVYEIKDMIPNSIIKYENLSRYKIEDANDFPSRKIKEESKM